MSEPLRYQISSLRQLPNCLSNNSKKLHIRTADYIHQTNVTGFKISIEHEDYGVLFAYLANAKGYIVTESESEELSLADLLSVLAKYGFLIEFDPSKHMDGNQLQYLANLRNFGYDKIRTLSVYPLHRTQPARTHIVAFKSAGKHTSVWISSNYTCSESQFISAMNAGEAMNLTHQKDFQTYIWDWLTYVANIDDILEDNVGDGLWT